MVNKEKITSTVRWMVNQVLEETYDNKIFDEIYFMGDHLLGEKRCFVFDFTAANFPTSVEFSFTELKKIHSSVYKQLLKEINRKNISFLQTMRLVEALKKFEEVMGKTDFSKMTNPKVNICLHVSDLANRIEHLEKICLSYPSAKRMFGNTSKLFEFIHQLDKM